jgi:hypothetical protein
VTVRQPQQASLRARAIRRSSACAGSATDPSSPAGRPAADEPVTDASIPHAARPNSGHTALEIENTGNGFAIKQWGPFSRY